MTDTEPNTHRDRVIALGADVADLLKDLSDRAKEFREMGVPPHEWLEVVSAHVSPIMSKAILGAVSTPFVAGAIDGMLSFMEVGSVDAAKADAVAGLFAARERRDSKLLDPREISLRHARLIADGILDDIAETPTEERGESDADLGNLAAAFLGLDDELLHHEETPSAIRMREVITRLFQDAPKLEGSEDQAPALEVHILVRGAPIQFSGILSTTPEGGLRLMTAVPGTGMIEQFFDYSDVTTVAVVREVKKAEGSRIVTS